MSDLHVVAHFRINPGRIDDFKRLARQCLEVCRSNDTGTLAYEWFLNEAGSECFVLETYDGPGGIMSHMQNAGPLVAQLLQLATSRAEGFGTLPAELAPALKGRVKFTPRFQGLAPAARSGASIGPGTIRAVARFRIHPGKADEFKRIARECLDISQAKDRGTSAYEWFIDESESECVVLETYDDDTAVLAHSKNVGQLVGKLLRMSDCSVNMFGNPGKELLDALQKMRVTVIGRLQGLSG